MTVFFMYTKKYIVHIVYIHVNVATISLFLYNMHALTAFVCAYVYRHTMYSTQCHGKVIVEVHVHVLYIYTACV